MKRFVLVMLALSLVIAGGLSYFASSHPDGLERVAENHGFMNRAQKPLHTVMPDYTIPGLSGFFSNGLAGIIGVAATFAVVAVIGRLARRKRNPSAEAPFSRRR